VRFDISSGLLYTICSRDGIVNSTASLATTAEPYRRAWPCVRHPLARKYPNSSTLYRKTPKTRRLQPLDWVKQVACSRVSWSGTFTGKEDNLPNSPVSGMSPTRVWYAYYTPARHRPPRCGTAVVNKDPLLISCKARVLQPIQDLKRSSIRATRRSGWSWGPSIVDSLPNYPIMLVRASACIDQVQLYKKTRC